MSLTGDLVAFKNIFQGFIKSLDVENTESKTQIDLLEKMLGKINVEVLSVSI